MSKRSRMPRPLGTFTDRQIDATDTIMRTAIAMAVDELPDEILRRILGRRPSTDWRDYEAARLMIAEHIVVRIREQIACEYVSAPALAR